MLSTGSIIVFSLIYAAISGFIVYYMMWGIDRMMNYGGVLWKLRFNKYLRLCNDQEKAEARKVFAVKSDNSQIPTIVSRIDYLNELYWTKAADITSFKLWICVECMTVRFLIYINLIISIWLGYVFGWPFVLLYVPINMVSTAIVYFNILKNELQNNG